MKIVEEDHSEDWPPRTRVHGEHYYALLTCVACPTQWEGRWACSDRPFYFRARSGRWTLEVGPSGGATAYELWASQALLIAADEDDTGGCMEDDAVLAILDNAFTPLAVAS